MLNSAKPSSVWVAAATMPLAFALSACDSQSSAPSSPASEAASEVAQVAEPTAAETAASSDQPIEAQKSVAKLAPADGEVAARELTIEEIAGGWRVIKIAGAKPDSNTANMKGAIAEIYPESASWSFKPKGAGALNDLCQEPVAGIVRKVDAQATVAKRLNIPSSKRGQRAVAHELLCGGGGYFGNADGSATDFALTSPNTMVMSWDGGAVLTLEKLDRPAAKENMKPEDYRASNFNRE